MAKWLEEAFDRFDLPAEVLASVPRITLSGDRKVMVLNHHGILEYSEELMIIAGGRLKVYIRGLQLSLDAMDSSSLVISGRIHEISLE